MNRRWLLIPQTGLRKIHSDSNYNTFLDLARYLTNRGHWCYMLMPGYSRDMVTHIPKLMYLFQEMDYDWYISFAVLDSKWLVDLFSRRVGTELIDAVATTKGMLIPLIKEVISDHLLNRDIECYHIEPGVTDNFQVRGRDGGVMQLLRLVLGWAYGIPIFLTEHEKEKAIRFAHEYVSGSTLRMIDEDSIVAPVGVDTKKIDRVLKEVKRNEKFTLFYGARINSEKQPERIFDVYDYFFKYGRDIKIVVTTGTMKRDARTRILKGGRDYLKIKWGCGRDAYFREAAKCHAFICWTPMEGFPVGYWEQMYFGLIGLFPNYEWAVKHLPKGYKWIFSNKKEAYAMLMEIADNWQKHHDDMAYIRELIRKEYKVGKVYGLIEADLEKRLAHKTSYGMGRFKGVKKLIGDVLKVAGDEFTLPQILDLMEQQGRMFIKDVKNRSGTYKYPSNYDVHRWLIDIGYEDTCSSRIPSYRKKKDGD